MNIARALRTSIIAFFLLLIPLVWGRENIDRSKYTKMAHVISAEFIHTTAPSNRRFSKIGIDNLVYTTDRICKDAQVSKDYPARLDGKNLYLLIGQDKICKYRVNGVSER